MLSKAEIEEKQRTELNRLVEHCGNASSLAAQLGISRQTVFYWLKRGRISATYATKVERETKGEFKRQEMRPDVCEWKEEV